MNKGEKYSEQEKVRQTEHSKCTKRNSKIKELGKFSIGSDLEQEPE